MSLLIGGLAALGGAALGLIGNNRNNKKNQKNQKSAEERQFEYNEKSADNAHQRTLGLLEASKQANSMQEKVKQANEAGLSTGLIYGGGGAGGAASASSGAQANTQTGSPQQENLSQVLDINNAINQRKLANAEVDRVKNETALLETKRENLEADTAKKTGEASQIEALTPIQKELMKQSAIQQFVENERREWEQGGNAGKDVQMSRNSELGYTSGISKGSKFDERISAEIAETMSKVENNKALAELNTQKKLGYWTELLNATKNANNEEIKANAIKLAAEWNTGEFTNWKTWVDTAKDAVGAVGDIIKISK